MWLSSIRYSESLFGFLNINLGIFKILKINSAGIENLRCIPPFRISYFGLISTFPLSVTHELFVGETQNRCEFLYLWWIDITKHILKDFQVFIKGLQKRNFSKPSFPCRIFGLFEFTSGNLYNLRCFMRSNYSSVYKKSPRSLCNTAKLS